MNRTAVQGGEIFFPKTKLPGVVYRWAGALHGPAALMATRCVAVPGLVFRLRLPRADGTVVLDVPRPLEAFEHTPVATLRRRHAEVFREAGRPNLIRFLIQRTTWGLQALASSDASAYSYAMPSDFRRGCE